MADPFSPAAQTAEEKRNWTPILVGLGAVLVVVAAVALFTRSGSKNEAQADPYVARLKLSEMKLSAAENYMGGTVTYLDVNITNTGDKTLVGAQINAIFKNSMGQVVQTETLPLHVLVENQMGGYADLVDLSRSPIGPGQTKTVRMTLEHISDDWDRSTPDMHLVNLALK